MKLEYNKEDFWQHITRKIKKTRGTQPITHRLKIAIPQFVEMQKSGELEGKFKTPKNLTIFTTHNFIDISLLEMNLNFLGMEYIVIRKPGLNWKSITKLEVVLEYLRSGDFKTDLFIYCDARDCVWRDDPQKVVDIFNSKKAKLIFNTTMFKGGSLCMPDVIKWLRTVAIKKGRYLNAGVFIGKTIFVREVLEEASKYFTLDSITPEEYSQLGRGIRDTRLCEELSEWPKDSTDQDILRYLHPQFYPDMDLDYRNEITYRN